MTLSRDHIGQMERKVAITPASNLGYLAPQDNFSWVSNCSLGPPDCETRCPQKIGMGYVKMHGFHGNP